MAPPKRKTVLLVEDDPAIRRLVHKHLTSLDVDILEVADARSALSRLSEVAPDLVCMDIVLPESNGYALCEHIRKTPRLQKVPILIISARNSIVDRAYAEEVGLTHYLSKPFTRAELLRLAGGLLNPEPQASHET